LHTPYAMLVVSFAAGANHRPAQALKPPLQKLRRPAEALICRVSQPKHSKGQILEEVRWEIGAEKRVPKRSQRARFLARASRGYDEENEWLADEVFLAKLSGRAESARWSARQRVCVCADYTAVEVEMTAAARDASRGVFGVACLSRKEDKYASRRRARVVEVVCVVEVAHGVGAKEKSQSKVLFPQPSPRARSWLAAHTVFIGPLDL
jgi:hypothetical protein